MTLLDYLLSFVLIYGYPTIVAICFLGGIGIPLPATSVLLAAGSLTVDGTLNIFILIPLVATTVVLGDLLSYYIGRKFGYLNKNFLTQRIGLSETLTQTSEEFLKKHGIWSIFITRWLITPLAVPINLIAGIHKYPFVRFIILVTMGEVLWASLYIYLGYLFGANWQSLLSYITNAPSLLAAIMLSVGLLYVGARIRKHHKISAK